jgi:hypothetical protein
VPGQFGHEPLVIGLKKGYGEHPLPCLRFTGPSLDRLGQLENMPTTCPHG